MTLKDKINLNRKLIFIVILLVIISFITLIIFICQSYPLSLPSIFNNQLEEYNTGKIVYIQQDNLDILNSRYKSDINEFIYCLYGENYKEGVKVTEIKETKVTSSKEDSITYKSCIKSGGYLGTIHSHPTGTCEMSKQDIFTFGKDESLLTGIICGIDSYSIYGTSDFTKSYKVEVI